MVLDKPLDSLNADGSFAPGLAGSQLQHQAVGDGSFRSGLKSWQKLRPSIEILCNNQARIYFPFSAVLWHYIYCKGPDAVVEQVYCFILLYYGLLFISYIFVLEYCLPFNINFGISFLFFFSARKHWHQILQDSCSLFLVLFWPWFILWQVMTWTGYIRKMWHWLDFWDN